MSRSGYYAWVKREASERARKDKELLKLIEKAYRKSRRTYGSPRVFIALKKQGVRIGRKRVERLMRETGLQARVVKQYRQLAGLHRLFTSIKNRRLEIEKTTAIDQQWVADITYIKVDKDWRFLATIMDLYSRRIISWSLGKARNTRLTIGVLENAVKKRKPKEGLVFHTDRGSEYRSYDVQAVLAKYGIVPSMNRPYRSIDNAEMESFFKTLKGDVIRGKTYHCEDALRKDLMGYINHFHNKQRLHSSLGYRSPIEYESITA